MLFNQPLALRFGHELQRSFEEEAWTSVDIAVAWVRASGVRHLRAPIEAFLKRKGRLSIIVGIDLENTTKEGLQALLELEAIGNVETHVHHNEAPTTFHPKLYLLRNSKRARLIVGSNNLTESGLFRNVEAGLAMNLPIDDPVVRDALDALNSWRDMESGLAKRLSKDFLNSLVQEGYLPDEDAVRRAMQARRAEGPRERRARLFGGRNYAAPRVEAPPRQRLAAAPRARSVEGQAILMRIRKAHKQDRPTQTQIPMRVFDTGFFGGTGEVISAHSGERYRIHEASARGGRNTLKLEIPEMRNFADPVIRFERTGEGIVYEVYDVGSPRGNQIMAALRDGQRDGLTQLTTPGSPEAATWWRLI